MRRRLFFIAAGAALVGASFTGALEGCGGGDDASTSSPNDGGNNGDSTIGSDDGGGGNEGGNPTGDGSTTPDSGGGGGPVSNPGEATCGPVLVCNVDAGTGGGAADRPYCCERTDGGDSCDTTAAACPVTGTRLECDEPADCPANKDMCCLTTTANGPPSADAGVIGNAQCNNNCGNKDLVLCKLAKDCGDGGACTLRTCKGGDTFYACNATDDCK